MEVAHMLKITKFGGSSVANAEQSKTSFNKIQHADTSLYRLLESDFQPTTKSPTYYTY